MPFLMMLFWGIIAYFLVPYWWSIAPISFFAAFFLCKTTPAAFWSGFAANALLWMLLILFKTLPNENLLANKMSQLLFLPHWVLLVIVSSLIGGLFSGLSSLSGFLVRRAFNK